MPQALLIMAFLMSLIILVVSNQLLTLSPQYATFGSQKVVVRGSQEECSLLEISASSSACKMTNISTLLNK
jgi:LMBR1 domain-containing protein 1